ncbi:MAG: hypothetical protein V3T30_06905, partial [Thermodesulfobacteriota bacterium]
MMVLRVVLALVFLGATFYFQFRQVLHHPNFYVIYFVAATIGVITILYAVLITRLKSLGVLAYLQVVIDIVLISLIVYSTGGIGSYLSILYFLSVIGGSIILNLRGGLFTASIASIFY